MPYRDPPENPHARPEVTVAVYDAPHEAHLAVLHLDTLGISARLTNELVVGMAPHLGGAMGGIQVIVNGADQHEAHAALEKLRREIAAERAARRRETRTHTIPTSQDALSRRRSWAIGVLLVCAALWLLIQLK